jgi:aminoglycoside phosphotransferase family enzyme
MRPLHLFKKVMNKHEINELNLHGTYKGKLINGKLVETHISWVILTKQFAFKIKKEMQYSFLNFSSLEKRKFYCHRELFLNSRFSDIYKEVLPVKKEGKHLYIGAGKGKTIEYTVRMKRLQTARQMNLLLAKNLVNKEQIKVLAKKIADFHRGAEMIHTPFNKTEAKIKFNDILNVKDWIKINLGNTCADSIEKGVTSSNAFLDQNEQCIERRVMEGFCRDGHGDLHSKNIFMYKDPIIFDCIEFNDDFRQMDVLNEVAFFCMDLEAFQRKDLSKIFMETYLDLFPCMKNQTEERLFVYYKCYRANVRAKVNALRAMQSVDKMEINKCCLELFKYLKLMDQYRAEFNSPRE